MLLFNKKKVSLLLLGFVFDISNKTESTSLSEKYTVHFWSVKSLGVEVSVTNLSDFFLVLHYLFPIYL